MEEVNKFTFRIWPPYTTKILEQARAARLTHNQFARMATMAAADSGLLELKSHLKRIETELQQLREDFNRAVQR